MISSADRPAPKGHAGIWILGVLVFLQTSSALMPHQQMLRAATVLLAIYAVFVSVIFLVEMRAQPLFGLPARAPRFWTRTNALTSVLWIIALAIAWQERYWPLSLTMLASIQLGVTLVAYRRNQAHWKSLQLRSKQATALIVKQSTIIAGHPVFRP